MDAMTLDLSQILSNMPIAGAMIWFAYHITNESRKERQENYKASEEHCCITELRLRLETQAAASADDRN